METQQQVTSVTTALNDREVSAYINKNTGDVIQVSFDNIPENPRELFDYYAELGTSIWTFSNNYSSPDEPQGYNGATDSFEEALGYVLGLDEETYEDQIEAIRSESGNEDSFWASLHFKLAAEKNIWLMPVSRYDHSDIEYQLGVLHGWDRACVGFAWAKYSDIKKAGLTPETWENEVQAELKEWNDYINGYVYQLDYIAKDPEQCEDPLPVMYNVYFKDVYAKEEVLDYACDVFGVDKSNLDDWVEAKAVKQVVYVTNE